MERLTLHKQSLGNSTVRNLIAENRYNRLGQLITKNVGGSHTGLADRWQEINYTYNIRGWLTNINNVSDIAAGEGATPPTTNDDLFAFQIRYQNPIAGADPLYNGNISQTFWKTASDNIQRGYSYTYDQLNRLRRADFYKQGNANITAYGEYISYDLNGNITNLVRNTGDASDNEIAMDDLGYAYENGTGNSNQLRNVKDFVTVGMSQGFYDGNIAPGVDDYEYDENGNMTVDRNKGITSITYNHLNLPTQIYWAADKKIDYLYNAAGQKLKKTVRDGNTIKNVDYLDGFQYAGGILQFFPHAEGYIKATPQSNTPNGEPTSYTYNYAFNYTDHLGNVRVSYSKDPVTNQLKILEENHYYPFGLKHSAYDTGSKRDFMKGIDPGEPPVRIENVVETEYQYKYNGKEFQDELGLNVYDYGWRNYNPAIGRWMNIDPLSEKYEGISPYSFALNSPVLLSDSDGREIKFDWERDDEGNITGVNMTVTGKVIDNTSKGLKSGRMNRITNRIVSNLTDKISFDGEGDFNINVTADIQVANSESDISETDHVFRIVDNAGASVGAVLGENEYAPGAAEKGQNYIYLSKNFAGRTAIHETLHSAGLGHIKDELKDGQYGKPESCNYSTGFFNKFSISDYPRNLMHQLKDVDKNGNTYQGNKLVMWQIQKMVWLYSSGQSNQGKQSVNE